MLDAGAPDNRETVRDSSSDAAAKILVDSTTIHSSLDKVGSGTSLRKYVLRYVDMSANKQLKTY
eukprot:scaffold2342_cov368-Pinguiococcus_pyrenoidosus.AAC.6